MKKLLGVILFAPWLFLGISYQLEPPTTLKDGLVLVVIHLAFIGLLILAVRKAKASDTGQFLGFSPLAWIGASVASYVLGMMTPYLAQT